MGMNYGSASTRINARATQLSLMIAIMLVCGQSSVSAFSDPPCVIPAVHHYAKSLRFYIADLKASFPENDLYSNDSAITTDNYVAVLSGLLNNVGVNGIRVPIVSDYATPDDYPQLYRTVIAYARSLGLAVYASPLSYGPERYETWSDARYAAWIADYVVAFRPQFVSPFNEAGFDEDRMRGIMRALRYKLSVPVVIVGPDKQALAGNIGEVTSPHSVAPLFDVIGAHNSGQDETATADNWQRLIADAPSGKSVWSTENPAYWAVGQKSNLPGIIDAVSSGVRGLVIWKGKPSLVDDTGQPTPKACKLAQHIVAPG